MSTKFSITNISLPGQLEELRSQHAREKRRLEDELDREREAVAALKATLSQQSTAHLTMESTHTALRAQIHALEDEVNKHKTHISSLKLNNQKLQNNSTFLENELREAESLRRKLHNEVQELRGNIRVFCRVRPSVRNDSVNAAAQGAVDTALATMKFPNEREANQLELIATGESATGTATMSKHHFQFDRVFQPTATQADVFEEVAHLTQSVLDGYNVSEAFLSSTQQVLTCFTFCNRLPFSPTVRRDRVRHTRSKDHPTASCLARLAARPPKRPA